MKVLYIQDQEIVFNNGRYYHLKSEHYFQRYLAGLKHTDSFKVLCSCVEICDERKLEKYQDITHNRIEYIPFPNFRKLSSYFSIYKQLKKNIAKADFCYIRTGISGIIAAHLCRITHKSYMFIVNEDLEIGLRTNKRTIVKHGASIVGILLRHYIKNADYACYVTKDYLQKRYPCQGEILGCSDIENLEFDDNAYCNYVNKRKNKNKRVIGTAGPIDTKLKGQDVVIKAIKYLKNKGIDIEYQLVGSGDNARLSEIASNDGVKEAVTFLGEKSRKEVLNWMKTLDIYIQPSLSEGLPRTIVEAMANAVPCVASDVGGIPELIPSKYLFHHNNRASIQIARIIYNISDNELNTMSKNNYLKAKEYNSQVLDLRRIHFFTKAIEMTRANNGGYKR